MHLKDIYARPGHLLRRAQQIANAIFMEECAGLDMTPLQYDALAAIGMQPGIDATRLGELIACDRSTLGTLLARLEASDQVVRHGSAQDRRVKALYLTPQGNALLREAREAVDRAQARILAPLTPGEQWQFMRLLEQAVTLNNEHSRAPLKAPPVMQD
ncbi:MAG: winged helix-turn-helix transcriptional regulator [Rhodobiaceae bacterium]|nr:winged helix-turn-helix transcriptional regulator [Rhodobiaceae bacterium]MCC0015651.1 winged helix-turn-helix transcriptional regulator [Rhodobiaceae bacterium]